MKKIKEHINKMLHSIQNDLDNDYADGKSFDTDSWETDNDGEIISYDVGYMNAMKYILKNIDYWKTNSEEK